MKAPEPDDCPCTDASCGVCHVCQRGSADHGYGPFPCLAPRAGDTDARAWIGYYGRLLSNESMTLDRIALLDILIALAKQGERL
jgi:hypothetical protein